MTKKEMLENCKKVYETKGCKLVEIVHNDGTRSGIANPIVIALVMTVLKRELDRQIGLCTDGE